MEQSLGQLGFAFLPPAYNGGTNAGDIFFNTAQSWQTNGTAYDLLTVAIHEFGHALGMAHSQIVTACMYANYHGVDESLTSDDVAGIQSIYSTPQPEGSNTSHNSALNITPDINGNGQIALCNQDISTNVDTDWYQLTVPASTTGQMVVTMQSSGLSSLIPKVTVYNGNLQGAVLATGSSYGATVSVTISGVTPGQTWYIKAMAAVSGAGGIGSYGLLVNFCSSPQAAIAPPFTVVAAQPSVDPSTTPEGTGWMIGGHFTPYLGILNALLGLLGDVDGIFLIVYGTLSGYGDTMAVGNPASSGHHSSRGAGDTQLHAHHQHRLPNTPHDSSETTIIATAVHKGADPNQGRAEAMLAHRDERPRPVEAARLRAVDAARGLAVRQLAGEAPAVRRGTTLGERARPPAFPRSRPRSSAGSSDDHPHVAHEIQGDCFPMSRLTRPAHHRISQWLPRFERFESRYLLSLSVIAIDPIPNAHLTEAPADVIVTFDRPIDPTSLSNSDIELDQVGSDGSLTWLSDATEAPGPGVNQIELTPGEVLAPGHYRTILQGDSPIAGLIFGHNFFQT
jgi:Matrixin